MFGRKCAALLGTGGGVKAILKTSKGAGPVGWTEISAHQYRRMQKLGLTLVLGRDPRAPDRGVPGLFRFYLLDGRLVEKEMVGNGVELWTQAPNLHAMLSKLIEEYREGVVNEKTLIAARVVLDRATEGVQVVDRATRRARTHRV